MQRKCKKCHKTKELCLESFQQTLGRDKKTKYFKWQCRECAKKYALVKRNENIDKYREDSKNYIKNNPNYKKEWKIKNKEHLKKYTKEYENRPKIKLKKAISDAVRKSLKNKNLIKNKKTLEILNYSIKDLKNHLEKQFEFWMNWNNWGIYNPKTWDDNNPETWTWQIDHIIPIADFDYVCENDDQFKKAWDLNNLRPYSAKQNILDGATRVRHGNKDMF